MISTKHILPTYAVQVLHVNEVFSVLITSVVTFPLKVVLRLVLTFFFLGQQSLQVELSPPSLGYTLGAKVGA